MLDFVCNCVCMSVPVSFQHNLFLITKQCNVMCIINVNLSFLFFLSPTHLQQFLFTNSIEFILFSSLLLFLLSLALFLFYFIFVFILVYCFYFIFALVVVQLCLFKHMQVMCIDERHDVFKGCHCIKFSLLFITMRLRCMQAVKYLSI